ncbi:MAG TPA: hypothetical protein VIT23_18255, partial [Terrimicrobiaceae bacterium]
SAGVAACTHLGSGGQPLHLEPGLPNARVLARRLGVTYKELTELVDNAFFNPGLHDSAIPWKLRSDFHAVVSYLADRTKPEFAAEKQAFEERLAALDREYKETPGFVLSKISALPSTGAFKATLLLRNRASSGKCNFDQTWLEFADGTPADPLAFLRLNLLARLWKSLGWTIKETGRALETFVPTNSLPLSGSNIGSALQTAIIYLAHLKELDARLTVSPQSRIKLLTLWADISTRGTDSLYSQLFLSEGLLKSDPVFDSLLGQFLSTPGTLLSDHSLSIQSALGITSEEIGRILAAEKGKPFAEAASILETQPLNIRTISALFRYRLFATGLAMSVRELIALKELSGREPFRELHPNPLVTIAEDYPFVETLAFVDIANAVKETGFLIEDLDYLLRHQFDETGKYRRDQGAIAAVLKSLAESIRALRAEHGLPDDPGAISEEVLRRELGLGLPPEAVERLMAMINGTAEFTVVTTHVEPPNQLLPEDFAGEPAILELRYNDTRREQRLTVRLLDPHREGLETRHPSPLFAELMKLAEARAKEFFENQLKKRGLRLENEAGFLEQSDFAKLFAPLKAPVKIAP